jgi:peptide/nickel transport system substrate-binding protein
MGRGLNHSYLIGWNGDNGDPSNFQKLLTDQEDFVNNSSRYNNPEYATLLNRAGAMPDGPDRVGQYQLAEGLLAADCPIVPLTYGVWLTGHRKDIVGEYTHPTGHFYAAGISKS